MRNDPQSPRQRRLWGLLRAASFGSLSLLLVALLIGQARETIDLYAGIQQRKIQVKVNGAGISSIDVEVSRRAGSNPMLVTVPPGTLFASNSGGVQNMVAVGSATADLTAALSASVSVAVACANMHLDVPGAENTFTVQRAPNQKELQAVVPALHRGGAGYTVTQAVVWIITDNAEYDDLGTLVSGPIAGFGSRDINQPEAAQAMMLIERARVDLRDKAIWSDRVSICEEVVGTAAEASAWCAKVLRETTETSWKIESLGHKKRSVRDIARNGLLKATGPEAQAIILSALPNAEGSTAAVLVQALGNFLGPDVTAALIRSLEGRSQSVRLAAVQALAKVKGEGVVEPLGSLLDPSEAAPLRLAAARALCAFPAEEVRPKMVALLGDRLAGLRTEAVRCLGGIGTHESIPSIEPLLKDPSVRTAATAALKKIRARSAER